MIIAPITRELKPIKPRVAVHETKPLKSVRPIMPKPVPLTEIKLRYQRPARETEMIKTLIRDQPVAEAIEATTDHAWLVVLGHFAQALGLTARLAGVALPQRQGKNGPPQTKLIEFLVGILGGIDYLQDLNQGPQPIATDRTIAQAWAEAAFSHYSQVSRSLEAADETTLAEVMAALRQVSAPFIQAAIMEILKCQGRLTIDVDLAGRPVSPTSTDYQDATFGWMDDECVVRILRHQEHKLWQRVRAKQLYGLKFRRQHPLDRFILDFLCVEQRLVIEIDGSGHAQPDQHAYDQARTEWLEQRGLRVLRFSNVEVDTNLTGVLVTIAEACECLKEMMGIDQDYHEVSE